MKVGIFRLWSHGGDIRQYVKTVEEAECYAAASRTLKRAEEFAREYGFEKAYGSYEELCEDPEVELIYIATPHSCHFDNMELCIRHKKAGTV